MTTPNPFRPEEAEAWDIVYLGGIRLPGRAIVAGASSPREWEEQKAEGESGGTMKWTGDGLPEFEIRLEWWEEAQFDEWETAKKVVARTPSGSEPKALDFVHPVGTDLDIASVVVLDRSQPEELDESGLWGVTIKVKQWRPAEPGLGKPSKSTAQGGADGEGDGAANPDPEDAADKMIEEWLKKVEDANEEFEAA